MKTFRRYVVAAIALCTVFSAAAQTERTGRVSAPRVVGTIKTGGQISCSGIAATSDMKAWAVAAADGSDENGAVFVHTNSGKYGPYAAVYGLTISPDGKSVLFGYGENGTYFVTDGTKKYGPFSAFGGLGYAPDGAMLPYAADIGDERFIFSGDRKFGPFTTIETFGLSPDGKTVGFTVTEGPADRYVLYGDKKIGPFSLLSEPRFARDGGVIFAGGAADGRKTVLAGEASWGPYEDVGELFVSENGNSVAFGAVIDGKKFIVVNGKPSGPYEETSTVVFSPDGNTAILEIGRDNYRYLVVRGQELGPFAYVSDPVFAPDGKEFSYWFSEDGLAWNAATPSGIHGPFEDRGPMRYLPDGKTVLFAGTRKGEITVTMGTETVPVAASQVWEFVVSENRVAQHLVTDKGGVLAYGSDRFGPYYRIYSPLFMPDGKGLFYLAQKEPDDYLYLFMNAKELGKYAGIAPPIRFSPDGTAVSFRATEDGYSPYTGRVIREGKEYPGVFLTGDDGEKPIGYVYLDGPNLYGVTF